MATIQKFYFRVGTTTVGGTLPGAGTQSTAAPTPTNSSTTASTNRSMDGTTGTTQTSLSITTTAQTAAQNSFFGRWVSPPLAATTIAGGNWTTSGAFSEQNLASNMEPGGIVLYGWRPSTGARVGYISDTPNGGAIAGEPGTSQTARSAVTAGTAITLQDGDVLIMENWADNVQGAATARTNTFFYDGTTEASATSCASFLQAPVALTLYSPPTTTGSADGVLARVAGAASGSSFQVKDTFTGTAGTDLLSHVGEVGATWARHPAAPSGGQWLLSDAGRAYAVASSYDPAIAAHDMASGVAPATGHDVYAIWRFLNHVGDTYHGIFFCYNGTANSGYRLVYRGYSGFRYWVLEKVTAGAASDLGNVTWSQSPAINSDTAILIECRSTGITVKFDGVTRITSGDTAYVAQGRAGLWAIGDTPSSNTTGYHVALLSVADPGQAVVADAAVAPSTHRTATVAGNWSSPATWGGDPAPGVGDDVVINLAVVLDVDVTVGASGAAGSAAVTIGAAGSLTWAVGKTLRIRGDLIVSGTAAVDPLTNVRLSMVAGCQLIFDSTAAAAGVRYRLQMGTSSGQTPLLRVRGTSAARATIKSDTTGGALPACYYDAVLMDQGSIDAEYLDITDFGTATLPAWAPYPGNDDNCYIRLDHVTLTRCGDVAFVVNLTGGMTFILNEVRCVATAGDKGFSLSAVVAKAVGKVRDITYSSFDKRPKFDGLKDFTLHHCVFEDVWAGLTYGWASFHDNFVRDSTTAGFNVMGDLVDCYYFSDAVGGNPHGINCTLDQDWTVRGLVIEANDGGGGDFIFPANPASPRVTTLENCLQLPTAGLPALFGQSAGKIASMLGGVNTTARVRHCTYVVNDQESGVQTGETYPGHAGMVSDLSSNLVWTPTGAPGGWKYFRLGTVQDALPASAANYNWGWNLAAGSEGKGYHATVASPPMFTTGTAGVNDGVGNPGFVDADRNLAKWATVVLGSGAATVAGRRVDAIAALRADPARIDELVAYVRAGFAPTNSAMQGAAKDAASPTTAAGGTPGAIAYTTGSPATTGAAGTLAKVSASALGSPRTTGTAAGTLAKVTAAATSQAPYGGTPYGGTARAIPGTIQAEDFDAGGEGVAYHDTSTVNEAGVNSYRTTGVDIQATGDTGGGYHIAYTAAGEWLKYTVDVATAGTYTLETRFSSGGAGGTFHVEFGGVNATGTLTVPNTGGWSIWQTLSGSVQLAAGQQVMRVAFDAIGSTGYVGNLNWVRLTAAAITGTAAGTLAKVTAAATGTSQITGSAVATLTKVSASAAGSPRTTGTAAATLAKVSAVAIGSPATTGTAAPTLAKVSASALGSPRTTGSVVASLAKVSAVALGSPSTSGTASSTLARVTATAVGSPATTGTAAGTLAKVTAAASGLQATTGTAVATLARVLGSALGSPRTTGSAVATLAKVGAAAGGSPATTGTVATTLTKVFASASGTPRTTGATAATLAKITATAAGLEATTGSAAGTITRVTGLAAGSPRTTGTVAATFAKITAAALGSPQTSGSAVPTLAKVSASAAGNPITTGTAAATLAKVTAAAAGLEATTGTAAATLSRVAGSATGSPRTTGAASGTLGHVTANANGASSTAGSAAASLTKVIGSATGSPRTTGAAAGSLAALMGTAAGLPRTSGSAAGTFGHITGTARQPDQTTGVAASTIARVTASASGSPSTSGLAVGILGRITGTAAGSPRTSGTAAGTYSKITVTASGSPTTNGFAAAVASRITTSALGSPRTNGTAAGSLGHITGSATQPTATTGTAVGMSSRIIASALGSPRTTGTADADLGHIIGAATQLATDTGTASGTLGHITGLAFYVSAGTGTAAGTLSRITASASGVSETPPSIAATFIEALSDYLQSHPGLLAELGAVRVYVERASTNAVAPYVLIEAIRESPGESDEQSMISAEVNAYAPTAAQARRLGDVIVLALDPPGINPHSTRTGRLEWSGGHEETALRRRGREPYRVPGGAFGDRANWARIIPYDFTIAVDGEDTQTTPDAPYMPDVLPGSLPRALEGYLNASVELAALLGGPGKVYADITTASGTTRPFVLIEDPRDDPDVESDEDGYVRLSVVAQAKTLRVASAVHTLLCDLIDPPGMSPTGRRGAPFAWDGGREISAWRTASAPELLDGLGPGGADVWSWAADYEFRTVDV